MASLPREPLTNANSLNRSSVTILAIDPGPVDSAYVLWDGLTILDKAKANNHEIAWRLPVEFRNAADRLFVEMIGHYGTGMPAGKEVFETCVWIGRFVEAWRCPDYELILRPTIKAHLCGSSKAKDANVRQALIDRLGAPGTKKNPGKTFGVSGDIWAALAVAVTAHDKWRIGEFGGQTA